jgi:uncharacterized protein (TIGR00369 family)
VPDAPDDAALRRMMPLAETLGIHFDAVGPGAVTAALDWDPALCTAGGVLHGGVLTALADSAAGVCAYLNLPPGASTSTIELKVNFLAAVRGGRVTATARPVHVGRTSIVLQTDVLADAGGSRRVALVTQTQAVLPSR